MTGTFKYIPPPPPPEEIYEYTVRMTGAERIRLIDVLHNGQNAALYSAVSSTANDFLKILGVKP